MEESPSISVSLVRCSYTRPHDSGHTPISLTMCGCLVLLSTATCKFQKQDAPICKVIANRLLQYKQTSPQYYLTVDTRVDKLIKLRSELNPLQDASGGKKISINDLVIKAVAFALCKVPECSRSWMNDFIRQYHNVNINVAVQTEHGLFVPEIRGVDKKGIATIADEVKQLTQRARDNSLKPEDYEVALTVSNLGGRFGIKLFCAIVNPPQSAILAIGSGTSRCSSCLQL